MGVCNCLNHFNSFISSELIIIDKSECGNNLYLFVTKSFFFIKLIFSEIVSTHRDSIKSFIHCYSVK